MIPYVQIPALSLFGLKFFAFEVLVAFGFVVGARLAARKAVQMGLSAQVIYDVAILFLVFGFVGAHIFHLVAYQPAVLFKKPWELLYIWSGISSYGGFISGGVAFAVYVWKKSLSFLSYADALMFGLLPGWTLGRLGCFTAHDHPGRLTDFVLAVQYPGGSRHDMGLYEALLAFVLTIFVYWYGTSKRLSLLPKGQIFSLVMMTYGVFRFGLDFLRAYDVPFPDARYFSLTPAQYFSIGLIIWSIYLYRGTNRLHP